MGAQAANGPHVCFLPRVLGAPLGKRVSEFSAIEHQNQITFVLLRCVWGDGGTGGRTFCNFPAVLRKASLVTHGGEGGGCEWLVPPQCVAPKTLFPEDLTTTHRPRPPPPAETTTSTTT